LKPSNTHLVCGAEALAHTGHVVSLLIEGLKRLVLGVADVEAVALRVYLQGIETRR
jgi:hypothetical protein